MSMGKEAKKKQFRREFMIKSDYTTNITDSTDATDENDIMIKPVPNDNDTADSGDIIYLENRKPISRSSDQIEDIKVIVEF